MAECGETFISPTMKSRMTFRVTTEQSRGERVVVEFENQPDDIGPPYHLHPAQEEQFEVLEGELTMKLDGEVMVLRAGQRVVVPPGARHCFWNAGSTPVRFTSEHRPALGFERFITTMYDLDYDGRCTKKGLPRPLQLMTTIGHRGGEELLANVPRFAQRLMALMGRVIGRLLGISPWYLSRTRRSVRGSGDPPNAPRPRDNARPPVLRAR